MDSLRTVAGAMQRLLGPELDKLAEETGVIQRQRKFTAVTLARMLVWTVLKRPVAQLEDFRRTAHQLGVQVTRAAILNRFNNLLIAFLQRIFERATSTALAVKPVSWQLLKRFTAVSLGDGTTIALPDGLAEQFPGCGGSEGASRAAMKIQVLWDFLRASLQQMVIEPGKSSDSVSPIAQRKVRAGSLSLFDLGYFCLDRFRRVTDYGAYWISRLQINTNVYDTDGNELNLMKCLEECYRRGERVVDVPVLLGATHRLACRMIAIRVPQEQSSRRRQQAREKAQKHGRAPSREYMQWQDWTIFVTNCGSEQLSWKEVVILYRTRWQIELLFKLWKSHNEIDKARPGASATEQLATLYAKLIGVVVQHWILVASTWRLGRPSLRKAARTLREWIVNLVEELDDVDKLFQVLVRAARTMAGDVVESRPKDPALFQLLSNPQLLNWQT